VQIRAVAVVERSIRWPDCWASSNSVNWTANWTLANPMDWPLQRQKDDSVHLKFNGRVKCSNLAPRRPSIKQLIEACREPKSILQFDASKPVCAAIDQMKSTLTFQRFIHSI